VADTRTIIVRSASSSSAGILLLFVGIVGLVAFFTGNLDRWITSIAGPQGGAEGVVEPPSTGRARGGSWGDAPLPELARPVTPTSPQAV
jgi:hypothetical protein